MTSPDSLIEAIARALFDAENDWRDMQGELGGPRMDDRTFKVTVVQWQMFARAALSSIEQAGYILMPKEPVPSASDAWPPSSPPSPGAEREAISSTQAMERAAALLSSRPKPEAT